MMIGRTVSHYRILEELGGGGMGVVYKAQDTKLKRTVALKFLPPELTRDKGSKKRFIHEAQAASALQHNNICTIHEIDETPDGQMFICMDCYEGETLRKKIERGPLPVLEALDITRQIVSGLAKAHGAGMVHRDIKPANIIVTNDGVVKILDFGLAKLAGATKITKTGMKVGTVAYMSPEQAGGHDVDVRSDIFSLGVVFYELLTGKHPFTGGHEAAVLYGIVHSEPVPLSEHRSDVPEQVQRIIERMMSKDAENRYASTSDLFDDITELRNQVDSYPGTAPATGHGKGGLWMGLSLAAVAVIVIIVLILGRGEPVRQGSATDTAAIDSKSIAVMAFADMSPGKDQEYFSDGIAEELLNVLARIPELKVISRSSAFSYKGKDIPLKQIAEDLGVTHILEGSVRKDGDQVRITAQLIEAETDTHLWLESYKRTLDDIFAIQDDIAADVVEQLKVTLLGEAPHVRQADPEAYALYLHALHVGRLGTKESMEQAIALLNQALAIDSSYADAWNGLASNYSNLANFGLHPWDESFRLARKATERALAIDPDFAPAHDALGWIEMSYDHDWAAAAQHFQRALSLAPTDVTIIGDAAVLMRQLNRLEEAAALGEYKAARDPVNASAHFNLAVVYVVAGRWDDTITSMRTVLRLSPDYHYAHFIMGTALLMKGQAEAALKTFAQEGSDEARVKGTAMALHALGLYADAEAERTRLIEGWGDEWPSEVAQVYAFTGDHDEAFHWLERSIAQGEAGGFNPYFPCYNSLHEDPRWLPLLERVERSPEQLAAIEFNITLPE